MKKAVTICTLVMLFNITGQSQNTYSNLRPEIINQQLLAFNSVKIPSQTFEYPVESNYENLSKVVSGNENAEAIESLSALQFKYAMMMNVDVETVSNTTLYNFIDEWFGTHYRMGGTTKKGIDCSAFTGRLLSVVYSFGVPRTAHEQFKICEHVNKEELMAGDLVFFNTRGGVSHVGVYLTNNHFVHSSSSNGVSISSLDDAYYAKKFIGGGRINQ